MFLTGDSLTALDPADGDVLWQFPVKDESGENSATPVRAGDLLVASTIKFGGVALKLETKDGKPAVERGVEEPGPDLLFLDAGGRRRPALHRDGTVRRADGGDLDAALRRDENRT